MWSPMSALLSLIVPSAQLEEAIRERDGKLSEERETAGIVAQKAATVERRLSRADVVITTARGLDERFRRRYGDNGPFVGDHSGS
jgi:hypothetical protein